MDRMISDADIERMLTREKYTVQEIVDRHGVSYTSLWNRIRKMGLHPVIARKWFTTSEIRTIMTMRDAGRTYAEISRVMGRSRDSIAGAVYRERKRNGA